MMKTPYLQPKLHSDGSGRHFIQVDIGLDYERYRIDLLGMMILASDLTRKIRNLHSESARRTPAKSVPQRSDGGA